MKTSTKGLHSVCGGGNAAIRFSSSTRGRYASMRASAAVGVDVGTVAPGASCRHSAGANCNHTTLVGTMSTVESIEYARSNVNLEKQFDDKYRALHN